jgi:hypothetical protein
MYICLSMLSNCRALGILKIYDFAFFILGSTKYVSSLDEEMEAAR